MVVAGVANRRVMVMGNCGDKSGCCCRCCDSLCSTLLRTTARRLVKQLDESETLSLLGRGASLQDLAAHREKIDGRHGSDLSLIPLLHQQQQQAEEERLLQQEPGEDDSRLPKLGELRIYVVTWNMNGKLPPANLSRLLDDSGARHDFYVIGLQEAPSCYIDSMFLAVLGDKYCLVASSTMSSLQLFVFARASLLPFISDARSDKVGVGGLGGVVGRQKGAVAVALRYQDSNLLFLSAHLAPHEGNVQTRNNQYSRIASSVFGSARNGAAASTVCCLQARNGAAVADDFGGLLVGRQPSLAAGNAVEASDLVVWVGDLNYRVVGHRSSVGVLINNNLEKLLWPRDQLTREIQQGRVFQGFKEGPLTFRPTYKYDVGTDDYDTSAKERVPSWTDRILFKLKQKGWLSVDVHGYSCIDSLKSSDHRPVKALLYMKRLASS